jgi:hypothetical protein
VEARRKLLDLVSKALRQIKLLASEKLLKVGIKRT